MTNHCVDGTQDVQKTVAPGDTFEYRFALPDAGTFWYHPHTNETVQLERGLYGVLVVRGDDEPRDDAERVLVFDDVRLNRRGSIAKPGAVIERHNGRQSLRPSTLLRARKPQRYGTLHVGRRRPSIALIPDRLRTIAPLAEAEWRRRVRSC